MHFLTSELREQLLANGRRQTEVRGTDRELDFFPVVKLFNPFGIGTWLLTEIDPDAPSIAFGLCDLGYPELGSVCLEELADLRLPFGMPIERDLFFKADKTISAYAAEARALGHIAA